MKLRSKIILSACFLLPNFSYAVDSTAGSVVNIRALILLLLLQLLGMVWHWWTIKRKGRSVGKLLDYLFFDMPAKTAKAGGALLAVSFAAAATDASYMVDPLMMWNQLISTGALPSVSLFAIGGALVSGYTADSALNDTAPKETDDGRNP